MVGTAAKARIMQYVLSRCRILGGSSLAYLLRQMGSAALHSTSCPLPSEYKMSELIIRLQHERAELEKEHSDIQGKISSLRQRMDRSV
jgi:hypothetical protein